MRKQTGTSLIEVLVVMVVLVIGILVVLRSYPAGFASLRHAENVSIAGRLAEHEMEYWKNHSANLPEGILAIDVAGNDWLDLFPGPPLNTDNVISFRRVVGEVTRIPVGTYLELPGANDLSSIYVLGFSPISVTYNNGYPINFKVYGGNMRGIRLESADDPDAPAWIGTRYGIDFSTRQICFSPPPTGQTDEYYISYSYYIGGSPNELFHMMSLPIVYNSTDGWISIPGLPGGAVLDEGSETVARGFKYLNPATPWSGNPYEYKLADAQIGILAFNPRGYGYKEATETGIRVLEAHITYDILDILILSEERMVPLASPYRVKLSLPFIKQKGETVETDGTIYQGLGAGAVLIDFPPLICPDVLIVNPGDGVKVHPSSYSVSYKTGVITFVSNIVRVVRTDGSTVTDYDIAGKNLRIYYEAENDWSVQLHKAYEQYTERKFVAPFDIDYRHFMRSGETIFFNSCDGEKTVAVTYKWRRNAGGTIYTQVGETHQISDVTVPVGAGQYCYITLNRPAAEIVEVVSITGVSIKARAVWREKTRWLHVDLDSSLTRSPTEQ